MKCIQELKKYSRFKYSSSNFLFAKLPFPEDRGKNLTVICYRFSEETIWRSGYLVQRSTTDNRFLVALKFFLDSDKREPNYRCSPFQSIRPNLFQRQNKQDSKSSNRLAHTQTCWHKLVSLDFKWTTKEVLFLFTL